MLLEAAIKQFLEGYFSTCCRSNKTIKAYRIDLAQFLGYAGPKSIDSIPTDLIEKWARELTAGKFASASIRRKFAVLRVFFAYWVRRGELTLSPIWRIRLDLAPQLQLPRTLTVADTKLLQEKAWAGAILPTAAPKRPSDRKFISLRNLAALEILFATGMRVGELVALRIPDWRTEEASLLVKGKGARQRMALLPDKSSIKAVETYLYYRRALHTDHDFLFLNSTGKRLSTQSISRTLSKLATGVALSRRVTPHMIRHTVATLLLRHGADIRVVQEVLGHASIITTQRYTHISKEHLAATLQTHHPNNNLQHKRDFPPVQTMAR